MNSQLLVDKVVEYIRGCNAGDIELMMSTFAEDVTAYFIDLPPVKGSRELAQGWKMFHDQTKARWSVDHVIASGQEVVIEWSQVWTPPGGSTEELSRGVDWFIFVNGQIAEIHQYYRARGLGTDQIYELQGFPYRDRNYPDLDDFDSHLPSLSQEDKLMERQSSFAEVNGTRLYYEVSGSGQPLVFIHGFGADNRTWEYQFETFAGQYRVIRYDMRGFGRSAVPTTAPYTHTADLKALLDGLGIVQACVIAQSMGGGVAIDFALTYPEVVRALVLVDPMLGGYAFSEWEETWGAVFAIAATEGMQAALAFMIGLPAFETIQAKPALESRLMQIWSDYSGWHFTHRDPIQEADPPATARLEEITAPALVIVGEHDFADHHAIADILERRLPNARKFVLPNVGHVSMMEAPEPFNEAAAAFLVAL